MFYTIFDSAGHAINDFLCGVWYMNYLGCSLKALSSSYILPVLYNFLLFKPIFLALGEELTKRNLAMKESLNIPGKNMIRDSMMWHIWRSWLPLFCIGDCDAKMVAVLVVFTAFLAVLIAAILRMYYNQLVPEGLPVEQHHKLRIVGLITKLTGMVVSLSYYKLFNVFVYSKS